MSQTKVKSGLLNFPDQTDFVKLPSGTTAQRPVSPEKGYSRYNTTDNKLEFWNGTIWQQLPGLTPPIITSISYPGDDLAADPAGGQTITINGSDFKTGATVTVGGTTPSVITFVSATQITFEAPAKAAGDYDIVVTNVDGGNATSVNGMAYNGVPSWTTAAGNLGTFPAGSTIPTITLVATEPDSGVISYSVTTGALPTGLTLTGADIDGNVPSPAGETTYNFSVTASDDENQESTERAFNIVVYLQVTNTVDEVDPFGNSSGVALYKLDGDATDVSGNYDGTDTNVTYGAGQFSQAASFNPSNSVLTAPRAFSTNSPYSVSGWAKIANGSTTQSVNLAWQITGTSQSQVTVSYDGVSTYKLTVNHKHETNSTVSYNFAANDGQWHHYAVTFNGSSANLYIDGVNVASGALDPKGDVSSTNYIGGANFYNGTTYYNGLDGIDQVRYFNAALTPLEVESLYRERTVVCGGQADTLDILGDNSCIATYQLNGNANDLSGNYSGTPTDVSYGVGEFDLAGVFNGSSSYVSGLPTLTNVSSEFSVSLWLKYTTNPSSGFKYVFGGIKEQGAEDSIVGIIVNDSGNIGYFTRGSNSSTVHQIISSSDYTNGWHNVVIISDSTSMSLYVDGNNIDTLSVSPTITVDNSVLGAINSRGTIEEYFPCSIDQVRIFNKALNSTEVTTLYNETACDALACSGTTNTLDILSDGSCIAAYPLDGSPADLSGNYNGVQTDVTYPVGKFDLGGSFNGSSSYIDTSLNFATTAKTVSLWFKIPNTSVYGTVISSNNNGTGDPLLAAFNWHGLQFNSSGNILTFSILTSIGGWERVSTTTSNFSINSWYNVVVTNDVSNIKIHINGVLENTTNLSGTILSGAPIIKIGGNTNTGGTTPVYFNGQIDQVRAFNKALSASEVTTLYNETACN